MPLKKFTLASNLKNHEKQQQIVLAKYYLTLVLAQCITLVLAKFKKTNLGRKKQAEVFFLFFFYIFFKKINSGFPRQENQLGFSLQIRK